MTLAGVLTDLNVLSIILFLVVAAAVVWRDRENIERYSVVLVRRTKHGIEVLDRIADVWPRAWRAWATLGIGVGFIGMAVIFVVLVQQTVRLFLVGDAAPPVGPVLPTVSTVTDPAQAGYLGLPFWHFLIGLSVVMVVHEVMHGVIARVEGFDIEYVGLLLIAVIPGAFVQPKGQRDFFEPDEAADDEEQEPWGNGSPVSRLRVLAAGPMANITLAAILAVLLMGVFTTAHGTPEIRGMYSHDGMRVVNVTDGSPAMAAGLEPGMTLTAIDGTGTMDLAGFEAATRNLTAGQQVTVETAGNGTVTVTLGVRPEGNDSYTFSPAPVDHLLPALEKRYPGTIAFYEAHNDWLIGATPDLQRARWAWIAETHPDLAGTASERIAALDTGSDGPEPGFMGIVVVPEREVVDAFRPVAGPIFLVAQVLFFVALLNLMIGVANLLPIKGLDGGWMLDTAMDEYGPGWGDRVTHWATLITLAVVAISFAFLIGRALF